MSTTTEIRDPVYAELLAKSLPRPVRTETSARIAERLLALATTEVLSGRRSISKTQAKRLAEYFHVPIDIFV